MLQEYEKQGKEFGLTHKGEYWKILLLFSVLTPLLACIGVYGAFWLVGEVADLIASDYEFFILVFIFGYPLLLLFPLIPFISTVPLVGYGMEIIADPDEKFCSRLSRSFVHFKLRNLWISISTNLLISIPVILATLLAILLKVLYLGSYYGILGLNISILIKLGILIMVLYAVFESIKLSIYYFLVPFILALDVETNEGLARKESKNLMMNYIKETFILFFRLLLLGIPSILLIIPLIWFIPYAYATLTYYAIDRLSDGGFVSYEEDEEPVNELDSLLQ